MIGLTIVLEVIIFILTVVFFYLSDEADNCNLLFMFLGIIFFIAIIVIPITIGELHGYIDYNESNDKDLARITAVTQQQTAFKTFYRVEVEYLTNTPQQEGFVQYNRIEKDVFYCYYENKELVEQLKSHLYEELWIISGYKGGYETYKDFGTKLIKGIELKNEKIKEGKNETN